MKKVKWREHISCILYMLAFFAFLGGITVESRGSMLDFSSLARALCCGFAAICVIAGALIWKAKDSRGKKIKIGIVVGALVVIIGGGILDTLFGRPAPATLEYMTINMPFKESDIASIEAYHYDGVPVSAEKKEVTKAEDISGLYEFFHSVELQEKEVEELTGASVTSFRFNLVDGTEYEIVYVGGRVKSGTLKISGGYNYFTSADIGQMWVNLSYEAVPALESELPSIPSTGYNMTTMEEAIEHDLSTDGALKVSERIEKDEVFTITPDVCTNSEEISVTNNSTEDVTIYLYHFGELIRQMSLESGKTKTITGLNTFPYKVGVSSDIAMQVELTITE